MLSQKFEFIDDLVDISSIDALITKLKGMGIMDMSSSDISKLIKSLNLAKESAQRREDRERSQKQKLEELRKLQEKEAQEKKHIEEVTSMDLPLDWENVFLGDTRTQGVHAENAADALILSLSNLGRVDVEYMASITSLSYKEVITSLKGSIYQNPQTWDECFYKGWETTDEYLSGNLIRKLTAAKEANEKYNGYFSDNVKAIEAVLPPAVADKDIYVTLGSPWVPSDIIDDFIEYLFNRKYECWHQGMNIYAVRHDEITGTWEIPEKTRYYHSITDTKTYGTDRIEALHILERTLNMKTVSVTDEVYCPTNASGKKRVINKAETTLALEKQQKMIEAFQKWVWQDPKRKERLENIFESQFSCIRRRVFDGSFLTFPTMSSDVELFPYQKNAAARIIFSPNTLLAHDVGSGKTYIMIAAGMELKRMGLSKKNLYVVPNNITGQWKDIFKKMYPSAKLLVVDPKNFTPAKREETLEKIRDEEFDGIIMAYSCFEQIPLSPSFYFNQLRETKERLDEAALSKKWSTSGLKKQADKVSKELSELAVTLNMLSYDVCFDDLGITRLFVDEAHNYKNVPIQTKTNHVLGIRGGGSKKCSDMLNKVRSVQKNGGGVIMATGTPITNSVTDAFVMQKYLQNGELGLLDLQSFDSWIGMFAERVTEFEVDVDTSSYRLATRFSKFHNLPELTSLFAQVADFHQLDRSNGLPDFDGYSDALIAKTQDFSDYLTDISHRADAVRNGHVPRNFDNMLKITTDGRKAALDLRLVKPNSGFTFQSKAARCAENVYKIYRTTSGTQLIFCDTSTPKAGFNMYDEMKQLLVGMGVSPTEIAYVHDATTEKKRSQLFDLMRKGVIKIMIGSTFKLGIGVNVQDKLIAIHHLDIPWRPADMTQREGRILRQGNQNPKVEIYRYITEGSFDAYSWQLLESKQRFITGLLSGSYSQRSGADIDDTVLNYAEIKALAIGNPLVKKRVETANELSRCLSLQRKVVENRLALEKELLQLPSKISNQKKLITKAQKDKTFYDSFKYTTLLPTTPAEKSAEAERRKNLREFIFNAVQNNELKPAEEKLMDYCGFQLVLPANMRKEKPFLWLQREGRYYLEMGESELGVLVRIDNFLDNLEGHINKLCDHLENMLTRTDNIHEELARNESYTDKIEEIKAQLEQIDKKLGVDKK